MLPDVHGLVLDRTMAHETPLRTADSESPRTKSERAQKEGSRARQFDTSGGSSSLRMWKKLV